MKKCTINLLCLKSLGLRCGKLYFNALQVVEELSQITGISTRSISDFAHVTLKHIMRAPSSM